MSVVAARTLREFTRFMVRLVVPANFCGENPRVGGFCEDKCDASCGYSFFCNFLARLDQVVRRALGKAKPQDAWHERRENWHCDKQPR